ncbi:mobilization protein MbpA [Bacteroides faecis]|nr:relaxase/mobilization nuclease domain-containing protein [Bacteroides faecis]
MIAKGKSISHGTAALEYDLAKEINGEAAATEIHRHELFGCTGEEMVQEMKPYFVDFPNVKNNCLRFEVSPSVEESAGMTDADWAKLGNDFMQRMGLMNHQYIIVKHSGTEKNSRQAHLHILANRVSLSTALEKAALAEQAARCGISTSEYCRTLALGGRPKERYTEEERELFREIARLKGTLQRLNNYFGGRQYREVFEENQALINELKKILSR